MPMLMLQCKTCGVIFQGKYIDEQKDHEEFKSTLLNSEPEHICSRGHNNSYIAEDYIDFS
jgi:hypothetical protein